MDVSRSHVTALPPGFITVRVLQLLFTVCIFALSILVEVVLNGGAEIIPLISAGVTLIILIWMMLATYKYPKAYNYWAVLAMEILLLLVWIDGFIFALSGAFYGSNYRYEDCDINQPLYTHGYYDSCQPATSAQSAAAIGAAAAAAFAFANTILFLVSLIVVSVFIARHRESGGHNKIGSAPPVSRKENAALMAQTDLELKQQNLALREQYLSLQQQHFELQRTTGVMVPPMAAGQQQLGQHNLARNSGAAGPDLEMGMAPRGYQAYPLSGQTYSPVSPQQQLAGFYAPAGPSQMTEVESPGVKGKERQVQTQTPPQQAEMSGARGGAASEFSQDDEITASPHAR